MLKHTYADLGDVRLHYVTEGQGQLIMFLHGFPEFWYEWKDQLATFSHSYQVVAPDLRGYNLSSKPADIEQYRVKYLVDDIYTLAKRLGHKRFILVGHDWGGVVAWTFAGTYPASLEKLIIINSAHPDVLRRESRENPLQQKASEYIFTFSSPQAEQLLSANNYAMLVELLLGDGLKQGYFTQEDRQAYIEAWTQPGALSGNLNYYRAARLRQPKGDTGAGHSALMVKVPTLVIWGEQDHYLLSGNLEGIERFVPDVTIKRIPDGSHWVVHERPALINAYIQEFIENS
jgi:epoxide hydrolase 4